jgi:hypothetical protein
VTARAPDPDLAPLSVEADLTLDTEGGPATVRGYGDLVVVDVPSLSVARALLDGTETLPTRGLAGVEHGLRTADVAVDVRVRGRSVVRVGRDAAPGPLSRALGAPGRVSLAGIVLAALRRFA